MRRLFILSFIIADKFGSDSGDTHSLSSGREGRSIMKDAGGGQWERCVEAGLLPPETKEVRLLQDYRLQKPSPPYLVLDTQSKTLILTNQPALLGLELGGGSDSFLTAILNPKHRLKQPEHLKLIIPHQYKKGN
jgi:hypothetical protein